jgi:chromate transport protein ChrA
MRGDGPEPARGGSPGPAEERVRELARLFLKLGTIAFGGPAAHIAMMDDEVVRRRGWLAREQFLDLVGAVNLIPGPNSTEMAIHIGLLRAGWRGLVVAGTCFILPAVLIVLAVAWAYVLYGTLPQAAALLYGIKPVIIAIVAQALWSLGRKAVSGPLTGVVGAAVVGLAFLGVNEILLLLAGGILVMVGGATRASHGRAVAGGVATGALALTGPPSAWAAAASGVASVSLWKLTAATFSSRFSGPISCSAWAGSQTNNSLTPSRWASSPLVRSLPPRPSSATSWPVSRGRSSPPLAFSSPPSCSWRRAIL